MQACWCLPRLAAAALSAAPLCPELGCGCTWVWLSLAPLHAQVRYQVKIDLPIIQEAMDKRTLGLSMGLLGASPAKARLARVQVHWTCLGA